MAKPDSGPAFPSEQGHTPEGTWNQTWCPGMSLRQWYIGQVMNGFAAGFGDSINVSYTARDWWAEEAVKVADALLRAEQKDP